MTKYKLLIAAIALLTKTSLFAGFYGSLMGGLNLTEDESYARIHNHHAGYTVGIAFGHEWQPGWRAELESTYRYASSDSRAPFLRGDAVTLIANIGSKLPKFGCLQPYTLVGLGTSYFRTTATDYYGWRLRPNYLSHWQLAYQWIVGAEVPICRNTKLGTQVRLLNMRYAAHQCSLEFILRRCF